MRVQGLGVSAGVVTGRARVILDPNAPAELEPDEILIAPQTDPAWTPLFLGAAGVIVERGAVMSHAAIVARELGIPAVVGIEDDDHRHPNRRHCDDRRHYRARHGRAVTEPEQVVSACRSASSKCCTAPAKMFSSITGSLITRRFVKRRVISVEQELQLQPGQRLANADVRSESERDLRVRGFG